MSKVADAPDPVISFDVIRNSKEGSTSEGYSLSSAFYFFRKKINMRCCTNIYLLTSANTSKAGSLVYTAKNGCLKLFVGLMRFEKTSIFSDTSLAYCYSIST